MTNSLKEMAAFALRRGDESPFDASQEWQDANWFADPTFNPPPAEDWAHRAARGIVAELSDDHGTALEAAFNLERIDEDDRKEIIETITAIIRQASAEASTEFSSLKAHSGAEEDMKRNQKIIAGRRSGVQSCDEENANVFVEIDGISKYARIDRVNKIVEPSTRDRDAVEFVAANFAEFDQLCDQLK